MKKCILILIAYILGFTNSYGQWLKVNLPLSNNDYLSFIKYSSQKKVWAISNSSRQFLYSNDGGNSFVLTNTGGQLPIDNLAPISDDTSYFIAHTFSPKLKYKLLRTINGGDSLTPVYIINNSDTAFSKTRGPQRINFFDSQRGFVMGDTIDGCQEIYTTQNGGQSWDRVPCNKINIITEYGLGLVSAIKTVNNFAFTITYTGKNYQGFFSKDYGKSWDSIPSLFYLANYSFRDSLNGIATRADASNNAVNNIAITNDGGKTWDTSYNAPDVVSVIDYARDSAAGKSFYIAAGANGSYVSADDGKTWKLLDTYQHDAITFYNSHTGISSHAKQFTGDGILIFSGFTGINDIKDKVGQITIYPNPAKNIITLLLSQNSSITQISLVDLIGRNYVVSFQKENAQSVIDISELPNGIYFLQAKTNEGMLYKKVLIER